MSTQNMCGMFSGSIFNGDISQWNISEDANIDEMFRGSALEKNGRIPNLKNFDVSGNPVVAKNKQHLKSLISLAMSKYGPKVDLNFIDVSNVDDMSSMFRDSEFNGNISKWDVSNVTNMSYMFYNSKFNGDISQWNISEDANIDEMFRESALEKNGRIPNLKNFDVSGNSVVAENRWHLKSLITLAISKYGPKVDLNFIDVSNVSGMGYMFYHSQFNGDISKWNVSKVTNMRGMFSGSNFNGDISEWDVSNVIDMSDMFGDESVFNGEISKWNVSRVINMSGMFKWAEFNGDISKWDVSKVKDMREMFYESEFNGDISNWNISSDTDTTDMFTNSKYTGKIPIKK